MSILDSIYKQGQTVQTELKGMNAALTKMQVNDKKEYKLDAIDRKYQKEQDKRRAQDNKEFHDQVYDTTEKQVKSINHGEKGKSLAAGLATATGAAIAKSLKKKRSDPDKRDDDEKGGGLGGPSFTPQEILMSSPVMPLAPPPTEDDHEERLSILEKIVFAEPEKEKFYKHQSGGFAGAVPNLGQPTTGDHFYTHVEPGSYVLNRNAVQAMGFQGGGNVPVALEQGEIVIPPGQYDQKMMDFINYAAAPRFQSGGIVKAEHPDTGAGYSVGKDAYGRPSTLSKGAAEALQKMIDESKGQVKTSDITSAKRSPDKNAAVGGVKNSNHLTGNAMDIHGTSKAWLKEHGHKYGWKWLDYSGHDGHFDYTGASSQAVSTEGGKADPDVKESSSEQTSTPEAAEEAGITEETGSGADLGTLGTIGGGLFAPFFEALNNEVFGGGDNKFGLGIGHIMGGVGVGQIAKIGVDALKETAGPAVKAAEQTIPQITGSKGSGDRSTKVTGGGGGTNVVKAGGNLKPIEKQALDILGKYESDPVGGYNAVNQYGTKGGRGVSGFSGDIRKMKQHGGKALTDFTIAEIMALQDNTGANRRLSKSQWINKGRLHAVGRYQFIGPTFKNTVRALGLDTSQKYTPEVQDKMALHLLRTSHNGIGQWVGPSDKASRSERAIVRKARQMKQAGGLVSLKKAAMSDDMSKFFVQTDNQLQEQASAQVAPQVISVGGEEDDNTPAVTMHNSGSNLPTYDLPTRDSCPLSVYYRYHPSLNPQGMNP